MSDQRRILQALDEAVARLEAAEREKFEPIAIVGMHGRFPGAADLAAYWQLLRDGVDAISEVPQERWSLDDWYDPDLDAPNKMYTRHGGWLTSIDQFDAHFFGIAPREAISMDPQQRLLLEVSWHALEQAGLPPSGLKGSQTGVFVGVTTNDYARLLLAADEALDAYFGTGNTLNAVAGRLAYWLGLQGPTLAVDTACSSSLVAVHLACAALRRGECDTALAGGVNVILSPEVTTAICRAKMLAPDGRCKTFAEAADGYVRGEGCGVVVLKRLSAALAAGDTVLAVIRGSAVNHDGASSGFTVPNGPAQQMLLRQALAQAKLKPEDVDYIEAHGTGTALGDPIEVGALMGVFADGRSPHNPLLLGSVKTNIGHTEAAAGIAGLIKVVLSLQNEMIPPHLHFQQPSSRIPWQDMPIKVPTEAVAWTTGQRARVAGVSSFGMSGTNAHVVVGDFDAKAQRREGEEREERRRGEHLLVLSGKTGVALRTQVGQFVDCLATADLTDVCFSAANGRDHLAHRLAVVAASAEEAREKLVGWLDGQSGADVKGGTAVANRRRKVAFLFTGQGSQYAAMGRELYEGEPVFRAAMAACENVLREIGDWRLTQSPISNLQSLIPPTRYVQPALFALEYSLVKLWQSWGIEPDVVIGHSVGEIVAACVAGVFSLADALKLVAARGRLMAALPDGGTMTAVFAPEAIVQKAIEPYEGRVVIAAVNAPDSVVISGEGGLVTAVTQVLAAQHIRTQPLDVSHAFHSPLMQPMLAAFEQVLQTIVFAPPRRRLISNVTGQVAGVEVATADYWLRHVLQPVRFADGVSLLPTLGIDTFVEIGAKPTLLGLARRCLPEVDGMWLPSLRQGVAARKQMLTSLSEWFAAGGTVNWAGVYGEGKRVSLPLYPFQRQRYWVAASPRKDVLAGRDDAALIAELAPHLTTTERTVLPKLLSLLRGKTTAVDGLYELVWRHKRPSGWLPAPDYAPSPVVMVAQLADYMAAVNEREEVQAYTAVLDALDETAVHYILHAFTEMGWQWQVGQRFTTADFITQHTIQPTFTRLVQRLLAILAEEGMLRVERNGWRVTTVPPIANLSKPSDLVSTSIEGELLHRCGIRLTAVLQGQQDPLQLLFPEGNMRSAAALYEEALGARLLNGLLAQAVEKVVAALPDGRYLRVLEIGAGTGGSTRSILPLLPAQRTHYTFTDISPAFTRQAEVKFADYDFIEYRRLDIEQSPEMQGLGAYDVVIAANVLHATRDLPQVLTHVRQLLAANGVLLLLEGMARMRWVDLIFGLTEGWWHFADAVREDHPLLTAVQWQKLLQDGGFEASALATSDGIFSRQGVMVGQMSAEEQRSRGAGEHWLVLGEGDTVAKSLRGVGYEVMVVREKPADWSSVLVDGLQGIVNLWPLMVETTAMMDAAQQVCEPVLGLVQALAQRPDLQPKLIFVTKEVVAPKDLVGLGQSSLWGLRRTLALEHPEWQATVVDVADVDTMQLVTELMQNDGEDQVMWGRDGRFVPRLIPHEGQPGPVSIKPDGAYLITGGLGGLGLLVAEWLAGLGARHLALVGRRAPGADAQGAITRLEAQGVTVSIYRADVANLREITAVLAQLTAPLRGVIHAAGALDDGILLQQNWARFESVLGAKVAGGWHLHQLTADLPLDFFVLFSSTVGLLGNAGQGNHAAAGAFLDGLAHYRWGLGLPGLCVDWGAWADVGAAARRQVQAAGARLIVPQEGLQMLAAAMGQDGPQVAVVPLLRDALPERPLFAELHTSAKVTSSEVVPSLGARLTAVPQAKRRALLREEVQAQLTAVLGLDGANWGDDAAGFFEMGMDSLTAVEFRNKLQASLERPLPTTLAFDYPSVAVLVDYLSGVLAKKEEERLKIRELESGGDTGDSLAALSEAELAALLDEELAELGE